MQVHALMQLFFLDGFDGQNELTDVKQVIDK